MSLLALITCDEETCIYNDGDFCMAGNVDLQNLECTSYREKVDKSEEDE